MNTGTLLLWSNPKMATNSASKEKHNHRVPKWKMRMESFKTLWSSAFLKPLQASQFLSSFRKVTSKVCAFFPAANFPYAIFYWIWHFEGLSIGPSLFFNSIGFLPVILGRAFSLYFLFFFFFLRELLPAFCSPFLPSSLPIPSAFIPVQSVPGLADG